VQLAIDESRARRPARDVILSRLLEVLLIEALRSVPKTFASQGLLRGLADERLAAAIRLMYEDPKSPWTVAQLAKEAGLSRSAFFERFNRAMGSSPMEYLLAWRMALAKNLLRQKEVGIADVARRIGYGSASAFSVAFTRHVGLPPSVFVREQMESRNL
jgi:transcriptional regulator GlxA family with amidase domain